MKRSVLGKITGLLVVCTIAFTNVAIVHATSMVKENDAIKFRSAPTEYTELTNLKGNFEKIANGYLVKKVGGDNHNISDIKAHTFSYETDITFVDGVSASLIFGAEGNAADNLGKFFGLELSRDSGNNDAIYIKMFQNPLGIGLGDNVIPRTKIDGVTNTEEVHLKVTVDEDKNLKIYVNGDEVNFSMEKDFKSVYTSGYFGFLTWNTEAKFENVKLLTEESKVANFNTNLDNLRGLGGIWEARNDGLFSSGNHDNFAISDTSISDFEYRANIKNNGKTGAGALVFRAEDNPVAGSYVLNVDYSSKVIKLFSFPSGGTIQQVPLSSVEEKSDESYDIKVQAVGTQILVYANNKGIMKVDNPQRTSGKLGLLTWNGSATYQDVTYKALSTLPVVADPKLTSLDIETEGVSITPKFNEKTSVYGMDIKPNINEVTFTPTANGKMFVSKTDEYGNVIAAKKEVTGSVTIKADEFVENYMNLYLTIESEDGFTKDIRFTVYKWYSNEEMASQEYRSQFHVTPQSNFMNDPNGMVYDSSDGYWHLFYQQSTKNNFSDQAWAHVRSKDLINWEQQPMGLQIDEHGLMFSGSAIEDKDNTSGLFDDNKPGESKLIAYYTQDTPNVVQQQALAYSKDHGVTWKKHGVVVSGAESISGINFRDPKVFKIEDVWYMVTAGGRAQIHTSTDLITWTKSQALTYKNGDIIDSECPMLYPAKVNETGEEKWIYGGSAGFYVVGNMKKDANGIYKWTAESDKLDVDSNANPWGGFGKYATMTFFEDGTGQGRQIGISWLIDFVDFEGRDYRGAQSLPQEYGLKQDANGKYIITCTPIEEVEKLRDMDNILYSTKNKTVKEIDTNILKGVTGLRYDLEAEFTLGSAKEFGFKLRKGNGKEVIFKYDTVTKQMKLDVSNAGPHTNSGNYSYSLSPSDDDKVKLRLIVDQGVIEAFGNNGEANISTIAYTSNDHIGMEFFTTGGDVKIDRLDIYDMKSMYTKKSSSETEETKLFVSAPEYVKVGETFEVSANIFPNKGEGNVVWNFDEKLTKISNDDSSIIFRAAEAGTYKVRAKSKDGSLEKEITIKVIKPNFKTNLVGWNASNGNWDIVEQGVRGFNDSIGDSFYLSNAKLDKDIPFTYTGTIHLDKGQAAGLVFGVKDDQNPGTNWYCVNIDKGTNGGIAKIFRNTGSQDWNIEKPLTQEQKDKKNYEVRVEYDGNGTLAYYLDGVLIGEKENTGFEGGSVGVLTFKADATFNNIHLASDAPITSIVSVFDDIQAQKGITTIEEVKAQLPQEVVVEQADGVQRSAAVTWNCDAVDLSALGTYDIIGTVEGFSESTKIKVQVKEEPVLTGINHENIVITVVKGATKADVTKQLRALELIGSYSDGTKFSMEVSDWNHVVVDFNTSGTYETSVTLKKVNALTRGARAGYETLGIQVKVVNEDVETKPSANKTGNSVSRPQTGDTTSTSLLLSVLLVSAGVIVMSRKCKQKS